MRLAAIVMVAMAVGCAPVENGDTVPHDQPSSGAKTVRMSIALASVPSVLFSVRTFWNDALVSNGQVTPPWEEIAPSNSGCYDIETAPVSVPPESVTITFYIPSIDLEYPETYKPPFSWPVGFGLCYFTTVQQ